MSEFRRSKAAAIRPAIGPFGLALREAREARRLSQSRLAADAGYDHSYVSRLKLGVRLPLRETVLRLADALDAGAEERDGLLMAGGYLPHDPGIFASSDPDVSALASFLSEHAGTQAAEALRLKLRNAMGYARVALGSGGG